MIALRIHLFSFRTQKLSSTAPKILSGQLFGKIGRCHIKFLVSSAVGRPYRFTPETDGYMKCKSSKGIQVLTTLKKRQIFLVSSAVEHPAVNRRVVGSNPTRGATKSLKSSAISGFFILL